jgi:polar amino acid transport system substrate-binding protein
MLTAALLAAVVSAGLLSAAASARVDATPLPTKKRGVLTVAIDLGNPGFAQGAIARARGFSVDSSRAVATRMGLKVRYVEYPFARLFVPGAKPYDVAFEFVTILPSRERWVDFSTQYFSTTQGVLVAKDITGPVTLARLRTLQMCAHEVRIGFSYVEDVLQPEGLVLEYATATAALNAVAAGICDAFVFDLPALLAAKKEAPARYGAVAGRVGATQYYGAVLPEGSPLRPAVNKAIVSLRREGVFRRIGAKHFGAALTSTPVIR